MVPDGTYTAVLDRFEVTQDDDELAVLLLEADGEVVDEVIVARNRLPEPGRQVDAMFEVTVADGEVRAMEYDADVTEKRGEAAQSRFDRLADRPPEDDETDN